MMLANLKIRGSSVLWLRTLSWRAILWGWVALFIGTIVFGLFLQRPIDLLLSLAAAAIVTYQLAPERRALHAFLSIVTYWVVSVLVIAIVGFVMIFFSQ